MADVVIEPTDRVTDLSAELTQLNTAISRILTGGQSAGSDGMNVSRANLADLYKRRSQVVRSLQRLGYGGRMIGVDVSGASPSGLLPQSVGY